MLAYEIVDYHGSAQNSYYACQVEIVHAVFSLGFWRLLSDNSVLSIVHHSILSTRNEVSKAM